jgi:hypothetical protein
MRAIPTGVSGDRAIAVTTAMPAAATPISAARPMPMAHNWSRSMPRARSAA